MKERAILVVEDDENDRLLIRRTLAKSGITNPRRFVKSGEAAISYLEAVGGFLDAKKHPLPALVLLDLKLPGIDGFDVLRRIRANPNLSNLRVVVLTTSERIRDAQQAYRLGANSFLVKPLEFENIRAFFEMIEAQIWSKEPAVALLGNPPRTRPVTVGEAQKDRGARKSEDATIV